MTNDTPSFHKFLKEKEVAELTSLALSTIRHHRLDRRGIPYIKVGRSVRYSLDDVLNFMERNKVKTK